MGTGAANPKFFCENCGAEVRRNSERCPKCGRYFASVRCPSCGFTGEESLFRNGCPVCGYCVSSGETSDTSRPLVPSGKLPLWVYVLVTAALLAVGAALVFVVTN